MKSTFHIQANRHTAFVHLNIYACTACWKCIEVCPKMVFDKSFLFIAGNLIHEHVLIYNANECIGCLECVQFCEFDAISINKK